MFLADSGSIVLIYSCQVPPKQCVVLDTNCLQKLVLSGLCVLGSVRLYKEGMFCMGCMDLHLQNVIGLFAFPQDALCPMKGC